MIQVPTPDLAAVVTRVHWKSRLETQGLWKTPGSASTG